MSSEANQEEIQNQSPNISPKNKEIEQENDNIINYPYKNQEIEKLCNNFVENLFLVNPKSYESFGANNIGVINKVNIENKGDLKIENTDKKYSIESSPLHENEQNQEIEKKDENNEIKNKEQNINIISKSNNNDDSDKEDKDNSSNNLENICKNFIDEIFSQENEKHSKNKNRDELNMVGIPEHTKSKKSDKTNSSDKKDKEQYNKNTFTITPDKVKYLIEHKKDIITIQKNWKTYYDVNRFKLLKCKTLIIQNFYRKYLIKKYNLPYNFYYNDKFLKMQTELYEDTYKKNLNILFPSLFLDKSDLNEFASNMLEMANNPIHSPYESGKIFLFAKILDFDMMIDTNECYETLWASIYDSIYTKCLQNNDPIQIISLILNVYKIMTQYK